MLIDRGLLARDGMTYHPSGAIDSLEVPDSLHTLIAARLDGLENAERQLLKQGAVLGKTFTAAGLAAVSGRPLAEVDAILGSLLRKEVLSVHADPRSPERGQYGFLQDLVRQVAYETLSRRDRRELHLHVAAYLEATYAGEPEEIVEVLAAHYLEAYREIPDADDAAPIKARACKMLARAGDRAASLAAAEEAQAYYERAIELAGSPLERANLQDHAGEMAWRRGHIAEARSHFDAAREVFTAAGDSRRAAEVEAHGADILVASGHLKAGAARLTEAYNRIAAAEPDWTTAMLAAQIGRMLTLMAQFDEAYPYLERALEVSEALQLPDAFSHALNSKGVALMARGRYEESTLLLRHALDVALKNQLWAAAFRAYNNLGVEYYHTDSFRQGLALFADAYEHGRRLGDRSEMARAVSSKLGYLLWLGMWDECLEATRETEEVGHFELVHAPWFANRFASPVEVLVRRGELDAARAIAERFKPATSDQPDTVVMSNGTTAWVLHGEGRHAEALEQMLEPWNSTPFHVSHPVGKIAWTLMMECALAAKNLDVAHELLAGVKDRLPGKPAPSILGMQLRYSALLDLARGQAAGVEQRLASAVEIFHGAEIPLHEAESRLDLGEWLIQHDARDRAVANLGAARAIFERLKARPSLERLTRVEAS
jgi:tetratricopeptide (TPR) repeat protein